MQNFRNSICHDPYRVTPPSPMPSREFGNWVRSKGFRPHWQGPAGLFDESRIRRRYRARFCEAKR